MKIQLFALLSGTGKNELKDVGEIKFCFARQVNGKQLLLNKECRLFKNN